MMGGGGSIQGMITSLRNNKNLLSKRKRMFDRDSRLRKPAHKNTYGKNQFQSDLKPTEDQLFEIRKRLQKRNKNRNLIFTLAVITSFLLIFLIVYQVSKSDLADKMTANGFKLKNMETDYLNFISFGDTWLEDKKWNAAIHSYKKAVGLFPDDFDANYRLALAYTYSCVNNSGHCESGIKLIENLKLIHGEQNDILYLEGILTNH